MKEPTYKPLSKDTLQTSKSSSRISFKSIAIQFIVYWLLLTVILLVVIVYIINNKYIEQTNERELALNNSYAAGFNQGVEYWNVFMSQRYNTDKVFSYWFNGSYFEIDLIKELCGGENG